MSSKIKIARVATVPFAFINTIDVIEELERSSDCDVTVICSQGKGLNELKQRKISKFVAIEIAREINILKDIISVYKLYKHFKKESYDIVHSHSPKAGLINAIAGFLARVPVRIHTFTGQRWATLRGPKRKLLMLCDKLINILNTKNLADSYSQIDFLVESGISSKVKTTCIHKGSFAGVNLNKFSYSSSLSTKAEFKRVNNIPDDALVITFLGRVVQDKGVSELVKAFNELINSGKNIVLLIVGPFEPTLDPLPSKIEDEISNNPKIFTFGMRNDPESFLSITDIFCLPSYREGFPVVVLQAAAMKVPTVGTSVYGVKDAIVDRETGLLCNEKSVDSLYDSLLELVDNKEMRLKLGTQAYQRVVEDFSTSIFSQEMKRFYKNIL
jgi:glycosyltransferase involved in cell wall biosynthesis